MQRRQAACGLRSTWMRSLGLGLLTLGLLPANLAAAETAREARPKSDEAAIDDLVYAGVVQTVPGSSTTAVRKQAIEALPLDQLTPDQRDQVQSILKGLALYRRFPTLTFEVDPEVYQYFLQHPDAAVSTWRAMEISKFMLQETGPATYDADAGDGSVGTLQLLHRTPQDLLFLCDGCFKSPVLTKPITAKAVMRVQTTFRKEADGRIMATHTGDMFVEFPSQTVETIARIVSPISNMIADRNFKQLTLYVQVMSGMAMNYPDWVVGMSQHMDGVPESRRREVAAMALRASDRADQRRLTAGEKRLPPIEKVLGPWKLADEKPAAREARRADSATR